jgi:hypothetical protein
LRRFPRFNRRGLKYFKTTSLIIKTNSSICISGLGLCGLYIHNKNEVPLEQRGALPIEIVISENMNHDKEYDVKFKEANKLIGILNRNDPACYVFFSKSVFLKPSTKYLITINNLENNPLVDFWGGECNQLALKSLTQTIKCNTTTVTFDIQIAEGVESDFDEFNFGIISSFIYQKID